MSSAPPSSTEQLSPVKSEAQQLFGNCWSCRLVSGGGLLAAAAYVYMQARKTMRLGGPTSLGTVAQIAFAAGLASWGVVVIADPVGKATKKA
ncbi:distal membrane-arm assembly complex protein 1 [Triplophysa rosa]|uniref:Transmembrane protein C9orf123-like protein n=1 Tax=Triplophysa rosa TaxID=992332 RepID=A0A9W7T7N6_TRIRA|nr:distal membrane-arm assembly complex protein 1 [Triplophysa rosa]KAI7793213.1 putative transmembrane protein C9orf123-like protein [Triplophysa rosa]